MVRVDGRIDGLSRRRFLMTSGVIGAVAIAGCQAAPPPPPPTVVRLKLSGSATMNPDATGRASPLNVTLYELVATGSFDQQDFFQLSDSNGGSIGPDLLGTQTVLVRPGQEVEIVRELGPTARAIGVVGAYRDIDNSTWRISTDVPTNATTDVSVVAGATSLVLVPIS